MGHKLGDIWKSDRVWKVQFPKGVFTCRTKRSAEEFVRVFNLKTWPDEVAVPKI